MSGQQHVEFHRKVLMRQHLLRRWPVEHAAAYVPFIGDGDLAADLYAHLPIYGADLDPDRIATVAERMPAAKLLAADCDDFPFATWRLPEFGLADFDAYAEPYAAFRSWWERAPKVDRVVLFFTDGQRQSMMRVGSWIGPDGAEHREDNLQARQPIFHRYLAESIWPWFEDYVAPWRVVDRFRYLRGWMVYWGAVIER